MSEINQEIFEFAIKGDTPLLQHCGFRAFRKYWFCREAEAIKKRRGKNITEADQERLVHFDVFQSFWCDYEDQVGKSVLVSDEEYEKSLEPDIPLRVIRAAIEKGARTFKEGPKVRSGLRVKHVKFLWERKQLGSKMVDLAINPRIHYTVPVKVGTSKILRTRALFRFWGAIITIQADTQFVERDDVERWLSYAGNYIGIGDWRPDKSGDFGRFQIVDPHDDNWIQQVNI